MVELLFPVTLRQDMRDGLVTLPSLGQSAGVLLRKRHAPLHLFTYLSYYGFPYLSRHKIDPIWGQFFSETGGDPYHCSIHQDLHGSFQNHQEGPTEV